MLLNTTFDTIVGVLDKIEFPKGLKTRYLHSSPLNKSSRLILVQIIEVEWCIMNSSTTKISVVKAQLARISVYCAYTVYLQVKNIYFTTGAS